MKKIQLIFAVVAFFAASIGVYATNSLADTFYYSTSSGASCSNVYTLDVCSGTGLQCEKDAQIDPLPAPTTHVFISKRANGTGTCEIVKKP